jgi:hypothetical protein
MLVITPSNLKFSISNDIFPNIYYIYYYIAPHLLLLFENPQFYMQNLKCNNRIDWHIRIKCCTIQNTQRMKENNIRSEKK